MAAHTAQSSSGGTVSSICIRSFARRACHGSTGSDCMSHRLFPSRDTEGAVMRFMDARPHSSTHSITGTLPSVSANGASSMAKRLPPFHSTAAAQMGIRKVPRPQLSI